MGWPSRAEGRVITGNGSPTLKEAPNAEIPVRAANKAAICATQVNRFISKVALIERGEFTEDGNAIHQDFRATDGNRFGLCCVAGAGSNNIMARLAAALTGA